MTRTFKSFLSKNRISALSFCFFATLLAGSIMVPARLKVRHVGKEVNHASATTVASQRRVQIVRFTLYDAGIYPQEVHANPGRVAISLEDLTNSSSGVSVRRIAENAREPVGVANKPPNGFRSRTEFNLSAGRYEIVDITRPDNRALLIVED